MQASGSLRTLRSKNTFFTEHLRTTACSPPTSPTKCAEKWICFRNKQVVITYWLKKKDKKIHVFKELIFLRTYFFCQSQEILFKHHLYLIYFWEQFTLSNSIILVEDLIRWMRCFEIFLIDHWAGDIGNKNIATKYKKILVSESSTLY